MKTSSSILLLNSVLLFLITNVATAHETNKSNYLPPLIKWQGKSEQLVVDSNNKWQTPSEKSNLTDTPNYQETFKYLDKLVDSDDRLNKISLGKSPQGRDIWMVIANNEGIAEPKKLLKQAKPTLLVQAGIHSGEIDGKDAGLMLMRDIIHGGKDELLKQVNWLFIPILSVDAHERRSPFNRVNQRGPTQMGWRTNLQNLNLNRDYAKLDTPELQHLIKAINNWQPDLYFDVHVTDGEDYQYDITYGFNGEHGDSPNISQWLKSTFKPSIDQSLSENGHLGGPLIFGLDSMEFNKGLYGWTASPRFSNGYGDVRHLPTVLVENHSLKPYKQRVLGTYIFLQQTLKLLAHEGKNLRNAIQADQNQRKKQQVVAWQLDTEKPDKMDFSGIDYSKERDPLLNIEYIKWKGIAKTYKDLPIIWARNAKVTVRVAKNYWLPPQYQTVIKRLNIHGIKYEKIESPISVKVTQLIANEVKFQDQPFEGHQIPTSTFTEKELTMLIPAGSIKVTSNQNLASLAVSLLDPRAEDSFFKWGFFNQMFQRTEYIESYAMIPLAHAMIRNNKNLETEFKLKKKQDKKFADDPKAQMSWFYQRSEFYDQHFMKYPVLLEY